MSLPSKLGKAAVIGGKCYAQPFATSDEFAATFMQLDAKPRMEADRVGGAHDGEDPRTTRHA
ncbi:MAG TPA: hypothetical protein VH519_10145 [Hyphomicrobiaceae bacterium]|jgi:hypothetical protein